MIVTHKGYIASISYEDGDDLMHGEVLNTRATLHFAGRNIKELRKALADTVSDYVAMCKTQGIEPEKPYSGEFRLRLKPELHRALALAAMKRKQSLNAFIEKHLAETVEIDEVIAANEVKKRKRANHA